VVFVAVFHTPLFLIITTVLFRKLLDIDITESFEAFWGRENERDKPGA